MQLSTDHIGTDVSVVREPWGSLSTGTYEGIRPSEWDGAPYHMFRGGDVNGTSQQDGLHGFPAADPHRVV